LFEFSDTTRARIRKTAERRGFVRSVAESIEIDYPFFELYYN